MLDMNVSFYFNGNISFKEVDVLEGEDIIK